MIVFLTALVYLLFFGDPEIDFTDCFRFSSIYSISTIGRVDIILKMRWFKLSYLSVLILCISLVVLTRCDSFVNVLEGELTQLHFPYPCNSTKITLQYGNRLPFYSSANPQYLKLNADQSKRFTLENTISGGGCFLQLNISPVTRTDAGTYILLAYVNDYVTRVGLHVDFLPGKAHCTLKGKHIIDEWVKLHCAAPVGSESFPGQIQCYQDGIMMPPLSVPSETSRLLKQTILVQRNRHRVFCCSSPLIEPTERCDCYDFVWDPLSEGEVNYTGVPCPSTTMTTPAQVENENLCKCPITNQATPSATAGEKFLEPTTKTVTLTRAQQNPIKFHLGAVVATTLTALFVVVFLIYVSCLIYLTRAKIVLQHRRVNESVRKGYIPQKFIVAYLNGDQPEGELNPLAPE